MEDPDLRTLISDVRATIISSKGGVPIHKVKADYKELVGTNVPLKQFGFPTIEAFLLKFPEEFTVNNGIVRATEHSASSHVASLVQKQSGKPKHHKPHDRMKMGTGRRPISGAGFNRNNSSNLPTTPKNMRPPRHNENTRFGSQQGRMGLFDARRADGNYRQSEEPSRRVISKMPDIIPQEHSAAASIPISKFKAKELPSRKPYRHHIDDQGFDEDLRYAINRIKPDRGSRPGIKETNEDLRSVIKRIKSEKISRTIVNELAESQSNDEDLFGDYAKIDEDAVRFVEMSNNPPKPKQAIPVLHTNKPPPLLSIPTNPPPLIPNPPVVGKNLAAQRLARLQAQVVQPTEMTSVSSSASTSSSYICCLLNELCQKRGISEPEVQDLQVMHGNQIHHRCIVKVESECYISDIVPDETTARELALSKAFIALTSMKKSPEAPAIQPLGKEDCLILSRIQEMVGSGGLWMSKLPEAYKESFKEDLPNNWENLVKNCPNLVTTFSFGHALLQLNPSVQSVTTPTQEPSGTPSTTPAAVNSFPDVAITELKSSFNSISIVPKEETKELPSLPPLPELVYPDSNYWDIYVVHTKNVKEIYGRLIGKEYSDKYDDLVASLEIEMMSERVPVKKPIIGELYATCIENSWLRVTLTKFNDDGTLLVYTVDEGSDETINLNELIVLKAPYRQLAPQAFKLSAIGLEDFPDVTFVQNLLLDELLGHMYVVEIIDAATPTSPTPRVLFWDTTTELDVNINILCMEQITQMLPILRLAKGTTSEMHLSHISDTGATYLQTAEPYLDCIAAYIRYFVNNVGLPERSVMSDIDVSKVYLAKHVPTDCYRRAKVLELNGVADATIFYLDYGIEGVVSKSQLYDLNSFSEKLALAPHQAVQVSLDGIGHFNKYMVARMYNLISSAQPVMVKVVNIEDGHPVVQLFVRRGADVKLVNSMLLAIDDEGNDQEEQNDFSVQLPAPQLPAVGSIFFVTVTLAVSPYHFAVYPAEKYDELTALMTDLQEQFRIPPPAPDVSTLRAGNNYAILHSDGNWYRGRLDTIMGSEMLYAQLSDFGNPVVVAADKIRYLPESFTSTPSLSMKARLADVAPTNIDWTPTDCLYFQDLVVKNDFASLVKAIRNDGNSFILEIKLIDTSSDEDVNIGDLLVKEGIAIHKDI